MPTRYQGTEEEERCLNAYIRFTRAHSTIDQRGSRVFEENNLTNGQFGVLESLYHLGPMHQGTLAGKLLQSKGNISTIISNLEKRGLVDRRRDEDDRRYITVHLTEKGRKLISDIFPEHVDEIVEMMSALTASEIDELGRLCKKLGVANARE